MKEKEKRDAGLLYKATDEELSQEMKKAKEQCFEYNQINPSNREERKKFIKKILGVHKRKFINRIKFLL